MKILNLDIRAYGPFTDLNLDFSSAEAGLHVVYGPNEAGKSSGLRALKAWLFGFPAKTGDAFLHPYPDLLVGGTLVQGDNTLCFYRRKRRKGDLVDAEGNVLDPSLLHPFLGGLDLHLFESLYGLDHDDLVRGGRDILDRRGEIGETLFSAGAGLASLHDVLSEMEAERDNLFKPRASKPAVNAAIGRCKVLRREIRELSLAAETWQALAAELEEIKDRRAALNTERRELDRRRRYLERLHRAAPLLARRQEILRQQEALGPYIPLPDDFSDQRTRAQQDAAAARRHLEQLRARLQRIDRQLETLAPQEQLIKASARIGALYRRLGAYTKALQDRPRLQGMRAVHLAEAERLLALVAPELDRRSCEPLRGLLQRKRNILDLAARHAALRQTEKDGTARKQRLRKRLDLARKKPAAMESPVDISDLEQVIDRARKLGTIDERIEALDEAVTRRQRDITIRLQQAGRWTGDVGDLPTLQLPAARTVQDFQDRCRELDRQEQQLEQERDKLRQQQLQLQTDKKELEYGGLIPSEAALLEVRSRRDHGWRLVCRNWLNGEEIETEAALLSPDKPLADTLTELIEEADTLGDRLRLEAERVHGFARLRAEEEEVEQQLADNRDKLDTLAAKQADHARQWTALWQALEITPQDPAEMLAWLAEITELRQQAVELDKQQQELAGLAAQRKAMMTELRQHCPAGGREGQELEPLLAAAEALLGELRSAAQARRDLAREAAAAEEELEQAEKELTTVARELADWQKQWQEAALVPGRDRVVPPEEVQDLLETVEKVFAELREAEELQQRMDGIDRDNRDFEEKVARLAAELAPELAETEAEEAVLQLQELLSAADREDTLRREQEKEAASVRDAIAREEATLADTEKILARLLRLAGCESEDGLAEAERRAADHRRLADGLRQVEQDLRQAAGTMDLSELEQAVQAVDVDGLPGEIHGLDRRISRELDPAIQELDVKMGEAGKVLEQMDGSADAAQKAEELENVLAGLREDAGRYLRLQLGVDMLRREIETFRRRNQDPVLSRASELFRRLTLESFSGLKTDLDDHGEPVLVGVRGASGRTLGVQGMSTGTRDQMYLALRLAALAHRAESGMSMPLIVDDILINFDDARTTATLEVLADQGRGGQFILFTHHRQVADQAGAMDTVQVHDLDILTG